MDHHASCVTSENCATLGNYEFRRVQAVTLPALHYLFGIAILGPMHIRGFLPCNGLDVTLGTLHPIMF